MSGGCYLQVDGPVVFKVPVDAFLIAYFTDRFSVYGGI
jgi:hypothetical protein